MIDTPLSKYPLLIQGGNIVPSRQRVRRASPLMRQDPFTLVVALNKEGKAKGQLYLDDGDSYGYEKGEYMWRKFDWRSDGNGGSLVSTDRAARRSSAASDVTPYDDSNIWAKSIAHIRVERVVVLGLKAEPSEVTVAGQKLEWTWKAGQASTGKKQGDATSELVIKNPGVGVVGGWEIVVA